MINPFTFCLSESLYFAFSFWKITGYPHYRILAWQVCFVLFCFSILKMIHFLMAWILSDKKSALILIFILLCVMYLCPLYHSFSSSLLFSGLNTMCLDVGVFWMGEGWTFILFDVLWASWICDLISFINLGTFSTIISSNISSAPFSFVSGILVTHIVDHFLLSYSSWILCLTLFSLSLFLFVFLLE